MSEHLLIDSSAMSDGFLELLAEQAALASVSSNGDVARWGSELGAAVAAVRSARVVRWCEYVEGTGFPDWGTCVDALPEVPS